MRAPLFVLTPNGSICGAARAMLGGHPELFSLPETNLFLADTCQTLQQLQAPDHGSAIALLGALAELAFLQQTEADIELVEGWLDDHPDLSTTDLFKDMQALAHPRQLVEASALYVHVDGILERITDAFPQAYYLHLSMHPRLSCELAYQTSRVAANDMSVVTQSAVTLCPDAIWFRPHMRILDSMASVPPVQKMFLRGEELLSRPERSLAMVRDWLGIRADGAALASMLSKQGSSPGRGTSSGSSLAVDSQSRLTPELESLQDELMELDGPLSWDPDLVFDDRLKQLAQFLGY